MYYNNTARCTECGEQFEATEHVEMRDKCPRCGSTDVQRQAPQHGRIRQDKVKRPKKKGIYNDP